jgi:hypothetical protein
MLSGAYFWCRVGLRGGFLFGLRVVARTYAIESATFIPALMDSQWL